MMGVLGYEETLKLIKLQARRKQGKGKKVEDDGAHQRPSRFIIDPSNYWLFQWSNLVMVVFVVWIFLTFYHVSMYKTMREEQVVMLDRFDVVFVLDRWIDLFVGFYNPNGYLKPKIVSVVQQNFSFKMVLELFIGFGQHLVPWSLGLNPVFYTSIKILRYGRLFEMDS